LVQISSFVPSCACKALPFDVCYQTYYIIIIGNVKYSFEFVSAVLRRQNGDSMKKKKTAKQIAAIVCIVLLAALYLITLLSAIFAFPGWQRLFSGCLICTVAVPILLWIFIWLYGQFEQKHTIASFDIGQTDADRTQNEDEANAAQN
jgi:hydrolase HAD superfamily